MSLPGLLIVGTDTGVGKTFVAAAIARALQAQGRRVGVLKPVATGAMVHGSELVCEDAELLAAAVGATIPRERVAPLIFEEPLAPPVAARRAGAPLTADAVERATREALHWWEPRADVMVIEGIGGFLCPLAEGTTVADLAVSLDYPLVVVARRGLGTLNHTLLTVEAILRRGVRLAGLVLNGAEPTAHPLAEATNAAEVARRLEGVAVLADLAHAAEPILMRDQMLALDWYARCVRPRFERGLGRTGRCLDEEPTDHVQRYH